MVDASAIVAILTGTADADILAGAIDAAEKRFTTPVALLEAALTLMRESELRGEEAATVVREFAVTAAIEIVPITESVLILAVDAFDRFGVGRHPARLNLADCLAYACAKERDAPLLYKGTDFLWTDIRNGLTR